jgi:hypothetical protein
VYYNVGLGCQPPATGGVIIYYIVYNIVYYIVHDCISPDSQFATVGCLNNDRTVMSKAFAWRPLALLPILKASACRVTDKDWLVHRRLDLYHSSMDHVIADLNKLCSSDIYLCFADNRIRLSRAFFHVLVLDGAEVAAATICDTRQCPVCTCPHQDLDRTDVAYPYRHSDEVKAMVMVNAARNENLDEHGRVKPQH